MKIDAKWLDTHEWMLRSSDNGKSYEGFQWKCKGTWTRCPDWNSKPKGGNGLHGIAPEANGAGFFYERLELCATRGERVIIDCDKIKVPEARIVAINDEIPDEAFKRCGIEVAKGGENITEGAWIVRNCTVTQSGGKCWVYTGGCNTQTGGWCWICSEKNTDLRKVGR